MVERIAQMVLWSIGYDAVIEYEFAPLKKLNAKEIEETKMFKTDNLIKKFDAGFITSEQAFEIAKREELIPNDLIFEETSEEFEFDPHILEGNQI